MALSDTGIIGHLQSAYGRQARRLIEAGYCNPRRIES
jgi:hypothetical protein